LGDKHHFPERKHKSAVLIEKIGVIVAQYVWHGPNQGSMFASAIAVEWLDHSKTLREQGIDPAETLLLRRKYFFSDQNVDARDPIQLNLLYVQACA